MAASARIARRDLKEDKVYVTIASAADFLARNRLWIAAGFIAILLGFALSYHMHLRRQRISAKASWALSQARGQESVSERMTALEDVAAEYKRTAAGRFASHELANALYDDGQYEKAMEQFREFLKNNPDDLLAPSAMEGIGYCQESLSQWKEAADTYQRLISERAGSPAAARAHYRLGLCYEQLGEKDKAVEAYEKIAELLPDTVWVEYSTERLASLRPATSGSEESQPEAPE